MNKNFTRDDSLASICFILQSQKLYNLRIHNVTVLARENNQRHFAKSPLVSPRNEV